MLNALIVEKKTLIRNMHLKEQMQPRPTNSMQQNQCSETEITDCEEAAIEESPANAFADPDYKPEIKKGRTRNLQNLRSLASAADRANVSDRAAAIIASSALKDYGVITDENKNETIDKNKVGRWRKKTRAETEEKGAVTSKIIYFDGKKSDTRKQVEKGSKKALVLMKEDHYVVLEEPGSKYIGHFAPEDSSAECISRSIVEFLAKRQSNIIAVGCDGTPINTGRHGGVIAKLEQHFGRALQWFICLLHANELPLRNLWKVLDGKSTGPTSLPGPIGKQLENCERLPVISFIPIHCEDISVDIEDLSTDQKYLSEMFRAIRLGDVSESLSFRDPGNICLSRWLTIANRVLRLYISTEMPSESLRSLVDFIMKVYVPTWFEKKKKQFVKFGAILQYNMISRLKLITDQKVIQSAKKKQCSGMHISCTKKTYFTP